MRLSNKWPVAGEQNGRQQDRKGVNRLAGQRNHDDKRGQQDRRSRDTVEESKGPGAGGSRARTAGRQPR